MRVLTKTRRRFRVLVWTFALLTAWACGKDESIDERIASTAKTAAVEEAKVSESAATPRPKRIILISLDTAGARHVGGYSDAQTPNMEKIAKDGVRFDRFYSASTYTLPAQMSMMTGLDPIEHGVVNRPSRLATNVPTLAGQLRAAGYETRAITESGFVQKLFGFDQGFSTFEERHQGQVVGTSIWGILDWMRAEAGAPYFLFVHTYAAHTPYGGFSHFRAGHPEIKVPDNDGIAALKAEYNLSEYFLPLPDTPLALRQFCTFYNVMAKERSDFLACGDRRFKKDFPENPDFETYRAGLIEAHRAGIRRGDRMVGQIRDALIELGQLEDTLLIVTSDHGDAMFEHGFHEHDYTPFNEVIKIPLFLSYPKAIEGGQVVHGLTWNLDLLPTILSLAHVRFDTKLKGQDLSGVMLDHETIPEDRVIYPLLLRPITFSPLPMRRMALKRDFKYIQGHPQYGDAAGLLFDLKKGPDELDNLRLSKPEVFAELRNLASDYDGSLTPGEPIHRETGERISPFPGDVEPFAPKGELRKELEALGYVFGYENDP